MPRKALGCSSLAQKGLMQAEEGLSHAQEGPGRPKPGQGMNKLTSDQLMYRHSFSFSDLVKQVLDVLRLDESMNDR